MVQNLFGTECVRCKVCVVQSLCGAEFLWCRVCVVKNLCGAQFVWCTQIRQLPVSTFISDIDNLSLGTL